MVTLRYYQQEASDVALDCYDFSHHATVHSVPTGAGKTLLAGDIARRMQGRTLLAVPFLDLVDQSVEKLAQFVPPGDIGVIQGQRKAFDRLVTVACTATLLKEDVLARYLRARKGEPVGLLLADECHYGLLAPRYRDALARLRDAATKGNDALHLVGLSATPMRADNRSLAPVFTDGIAYSISPLELILGGYLSDVKPYDIDTNFDPNGLDIDDEEEDLDRHFLPGSLLGRRLEASNRRERAYWAWHTLAKECSGTLIFGQNVSDCYRWQEFFRAKGVDCEVVTGKMSKETRDAIYARFASGELKVIANYNVLSTGIDFPFIRCIILGRVMHRGLFQQCVGRGLRLFPGKEHLVLLNLTDTKHTLSAVRELTGRDDVASVPSVRQVVEERLKEEEQKEGPFPEEEERERREPGLRVREVQARTTDLFTGDGWQYHAATASYTKSQPGLGTVVVEQDLSGCRVYHTLKSEGGRRTWLGETNQKSVPARLAKAIGQEHLEWRRHQQAVRSQQEHPERRLPISEGQWRHLKNRRVPWIGQNPEEARRAGMTVGDYLRCKELLDASPHTPVIEINKAHQWRCAGPVRREQAPPAPPPTTPPTTQAHARR